MKTTTLRSLMALLFVLALALAAGACAPTGVGVHAVYDSHPHYVASTYPQYYWVDGYTYYGHHHSRWIPGRWVRSHHHHHSYVAPSYRVYRHRSYAPAPQDTSGVRPRESRRVYSGYYH